jgi:hypothetical protein
MSAVIVSGSAAPSVRHRRLRRGPVPAKAHSRRISPLAVQDRSRGDVLDEVRAAFAAELGAELDPAADNRCKSDREGAARPPSKI